MGLAWINPLYLAGLLLLALPVLIHLVQKHHRQGMRFPSLMFLQQIPQREKQRLEIRHWLLLLLRCLLLLLIVLAFARPWFTAASATGALQPGREDSIIVLDRSYSMRIADHWQQALAKAVQLVDAKRAGDRIGILLIDTETELVQDLTTSSDRLLGALRDQSPGFRATRLPLAIEQASRLLAGSNASRKRILVISDFQAAGASAVARISGDVELDTSPVELTRAANASITAVTIEAPPRAASDAFSLSVEIANRAAIPLEQEVTLTLDGRELARRKLRLAPAATVRERFDQLGASDALMRGVVSLADDALALDNRHYFIYSHKQQLPLLIVEGSSTRANQSVFLQNALGLSRNPVFRVERLALDSLQPQDLSSQAAIILNDVTMPAGPLADALAGFVAAGGGLLVIAGTAAQPNWPVALLPGSPARVVAAKPGSAFSLADFAPDHPLATRLGARNTAELSQARVFNYRQLQAGVGDRVVARYSDGAVALVERQVGKGRVQVLTTTLDTHWNDIALQPVFLPFLHHSMRHLAAFEPYSNQSTIGSITDLMRHARAVAGADTIAAAGASGPLVVESPTAGEIRVGRQSPLLTLTQPGFYQVHNAALPGVEISLAANVDPQEANQQTLDLDRFVREIKASASPADTSTALNQRQAAEYEQQQQLAYAILLVALALMLVEALAANWIGIRQSMRTPGGG